MLRNKDGQNALVFCLDTNTGGPRSDVATQLVPYVSIDGATGQALTRTTVTALDTVRFPGWYAALPTAAETNGDELLFSATCSDDTVDILAQRYTPEVGGNRAVTITEVRAR